MSAALTDILHADLFDSLPGTRLRARLARIAACVATECWRGGGALSEVLLVRFSNPASTADGSALPGGAAVVRLKLARGLLYSLRLSGAIEAGIEQLDALAGWLADQPYEEAAFDAYEAALARLLGQAGAGGCRLRIERDAHLTRIGGTPVRTAGKVVLAALNELRRAHQLAPLDCCPAPVEAMLARQLAPDHPALTRFLQQLEPDALAYARDGDPRATMAADRLAIYNFFADQAGQLCRNRVQAARAMPSLLPVLTGRRLTPAWRADPRQAALAGAATGRIVAAIDQSLPMLDSVAQAFEVPRETVRWLRARELPPGWRIDAANMGLLLSMLSWIAPEKRPANPDQFEALLMAAQSLARLLRPMLERPQGVVSLLAPRFRGLLRDWIGELARPDCGALVANLARLEGGQGRVAGAGDFLAALERAILNHTAMAPGAVPMACSEAFVLAWVQARSLRQLLAASERWHTVLRQPAQAAAVRADEGGVEGAAEQCEDADACWPPVLPQALQLGQLSVVELTDAASLRREGMALEHCVAGYRENCLSRHSLIFSVRDAAGGSLSTAELYLDPAGLQVTPLQHTGLRNALPSGECRAAIERLLARLNSAACRDALAGRAAFQQLHASRRRSQLAQHLDQHERAMEQAAWQVLTGAALPEQRLALEALAAQVLPAAPDFAVRDGG